MKYMNGTKCNRNIPIFDNVFTSIISPIYTRTFPMLPIFKTNAIFQKLPASA